jgi:hypothetical protein
MVGKTSSTTQSITVCPETDAGYRVTTRQVVDDITERGSLDEEYAHVPVESRNCRRIIATPGPAALRRPDHAERRHASWRPACVRWLRRRDRRRRFGKHRRHAGAGRASWRKSHSVRTGSAIGPQKQFAVETGEARLGTVHRRRRAGQRGTAEEPSKPRLKDALFRAYRFARCNRFMGRYLRHGEGYPDWSLRLFDRRQARWSDDPVHEKVVTEGRIGELPATCCTTPRRSLDAYLDQAEPLHDAGRR